MTVYEQHLNGRAFFFIEFDIGFDIIGDTVQHRRRPHPYRMGPPRGMLRHITLLILRQQPKSGTELMDEIEQYTDWRPSPGSIYPMLAHLQEDGLIKSQPERDPNLRRYVLTEEGEREVEEHLHFDAQFKRRARTIRKIYWCLHRKMPEEVYNSFATLLRQIDVASRNAVDDPERRHLLIDMLDKTTEKLKSLEESPDE